MLLALALLSVLGSVVLFVGWSGQNHKREEVRRSEFIKAIKDKENKSWQNSKIQ
jgi:hypothetical protein